MKFLNADKYQPACNKLYLQYQSKVSKLLPEARIEHIGASSVPGAISKGDLDIFVGVEAPELEKSVEILKTLGFQEKLGTLRTPELCMLESKTEDVAFQVVANGSEFEDFLIFRDRLRANSELLKQYNELKRSCEGLSHEDYRSRKSVFVEQVLSKS